MCYKDFGNIFNKIFVCFDFPPSFISLRFSDEWSREQSGGIPQNNTEQEMISWAKNPQYYINCKKPTDLYISLLQKDGRMNKSKFPFSDYTRKACIVITKTSEKKKLDKFNSDKIYLISKIRQHRENSMFIDNSSRRVYYINLYFN
jgi:hypothetical protein